MSGMNELLGDVFGTAKTAAVATSEDLEKQAQLTFFGALCTEHQIDVTKLAEADIQKLWDTAIEMRKEAEFPPGVAAGKGGGDDDKKKEDEEKKAKEKKAAASAEYQEKRAAAAKIAEADYMGRIMAHSLVDEMRKIAADMEGGKPPFPPKKGEEEGKDKEEAEKKASADRAAALVTALQNRKTAAAAAPADAGSASMPNFDELAAHHAIEMLKNAGVDEKLAFSRVDAVYTLGLPDSTKIASAESEERALTLRGLEFCEAAGFQVDWSKA